MGVSISVERLRGWLLAGAGLLVMVIIGFLGYAHYRAHRFLTELPHRLGADIRQETNGFTYSQSDGKRTIYTIHASKAIQHKDGRYTLHDVGIVLYGRKGDRADRIYGSEFEYDQKAGAVRAMGEVHLDLEAPAAKDDNAKMDYAAGKDLQGRHEADGAHVIHVTTSGLVYLQKLGVAATDQAIEFEAGGMKGQAMGADYTSDTGVLVLHSAVKMAGVERGRPAVLTASRAELDRENQKVTLAQAKYVSTVTNGGTETAQAERTVVHLRSDGTVERLEGEGGVRLKGADGGTVAAPRGFVTLNAENEPQLAVLSGGVTYGMDEPLRKAQGGSSEARAVFDKAGKLEQVVLTDAVHLRERMRRSVAAREPWGERDLSAGEVELSLNADGAGKMHLRNAKASGDARLSVVSAATSQPSNARKGVTGGMVSSSLAGDVLTAHFAQVGGVDHLATVHADGHTSLRRVGAKEMVNTSSADSLEAVFRPAGGGEKHAGRNGVGSDAIASAVEQGHVVLTQQPVKKAGQTVAPAEERATAERAAYDGALEKTTLTGNVQVRDAESILWADRVVADQKTGDAVADGAVKVSYLQVGESKGTAGARGSKGGASADDGEPVHVVAARAELKHDAGTAVFYGAADSPARLWQGASQVEAPVIQFEQKQKRLAARGSGPGAPMAVHAVLTSAARPDRPRAGADAAKAGVFQIASRELTYSDEKREAQFTGGVEVTSADGRMLGQQAAVYLQAAEPGGAEAAMAGTHVPKSGPGAPSSSGSGRAGHGALGSSGSGRAGHEAPSSSGGLLGGSVERMVVDGDIVLDQPGRRASGEHLVYTASDGTFVLTGTPSALPKVVDEQRGTVTGTLLEFHAGDESVVVSNGGSGAGHRVRTETRVKKQR